MRSWQRAVVVANVLAWALLGAATVAHAQDPAMRAPAAPIFGATEAHYTLETGVPVETGLAPMFFQTVTNPNIVEFTASTDHSAVVGTTNVLDRYDVEVYVGAGGQPPVKVIPIGKPVPAAGTITYTGLAAAMAAAPAVPAGSNYTVKVAAVGPGGTTRSALSNSFQLLPAPAATVGAPVVR